MRIRWKRVIIGLFDIVLGVYLVFAVTTLRAKQTGVATCMATEVLVSDSAQEAFLDANEVKRILRSRGLLPDGKKMAAVSPRKIEDALTTSGPFVKTAQCWKTQDGRVQIAITQRMPILRVKSAGGADYYIDDKGSPLPNSRYTSDMIVATGAISQWYAKYALTPFIKTIAASDFWQNQVEQINILPDRGVELVPRVGDHILFLGYLPTDEQNRAKRDEAIADFTNRKLLRIEKFYRYALSKVGWNKYSYISVEFDNQIICKKKKNQETI